MSATPVCYKCKSTDELSIKYFTRVTHIPRYMCKPCRRAAYKSYPKLPKLSYPFTEEEWNNQAVASRQRILHRFNKGRMVTHD